MEEHESEYFQLKFKKKKKKILAFILHFRCRELHKSGTDLNNIGDNVLIIPSMNMKMYLYKEIAPICDSMLSIFQALGIYLMYLYLTSSQSSRASNVNQI